MKVVLRILAGLLCVSSLAADSIKTMEFRNQDIRDILLSFGALNGVSIVPDETVEGQATYVFSNMEFDKALAAFLETVGLSDNLAGGIHRISRVSLKMLDSGNFDLDAADVRVQSLLRVVSARTSKTILNDGIPNEFVTVRLRNATVEDVLKVVAARYPQFQIVKQDKFFYLKSVLSGQGPSNATSGKGLTRTGDRYSIEVDRGRFREVLQSLFDLAGKESLFLLDRDTVFEGLKLKDKSFEDMLKIILLYGNADVTAVNGIYTVVDAQRRDLMKQYLSNVVVPLEFLSASDFLRLVPAELASGQGYKIDEKGNKIIFTGSPDQIKPLFDFLKLVDQPLKGNSLMRVDLEYLKTDEALPLLPSDLAAFVPQALPSRTAFLIQLPETRKASLEAWRKMVDRPQVGTPIRLHYLKSDELFAKIPPSAVEANLVRTNDPSLVFFKGSAAQRADFLRDLAEIDLPRAQIRYEVLVMQFDEGKGLNLSSNPSVTKVASGGGNSFVGGLDKLITMNFDVVADFGYQFALSLSASLKNNDSKVLADTTLNGLSGEKISFQNTQTLRYPDTQVNPDTGKYVTIIRDLPSGLLLTLEGWVSADGMITVKVDSTLSQAVATDSASGTGTSAPSTFEKKLSTQIRTPSGKPLVISGLKQDSVSSVVTKLPILGDIPWLGTLFQQRSESVQRTEFAIYIVPIVERPGRQDSGATDRLASYYRRLVKEQG